jgi:Raf kinase inhibitor-like YbhB/YbcL family protein
MKLLSSTFKNGERIPENCAFGIPADDAPMQLGNNQNPHLQWTDVPEDARSLVLVCIDPDVPTVADDVNQKGRTISASLPRTDFCHWVILDLPAGDGEIEVGSCSGEVTIGGKPAPSGPEGSRQGVNDYTNFFAGDADMSGTYLGYDGPCPPWNDEILHHYHFIVYATDLPQCPVGENFTLSDVRQALEGHVLTEARLVGTYSLNPAVR